MNQVSENQTNNKIQTYCLVTLTVLAVAYSTSLLKAILVPLSLAFVIRVMLEPIFRYQTDRLKLPTWFSSIVSLILGLTMIGSLVLLLSNAIRTLGSSVESLKENFKDPLSVHFPFFEKNVFESIEPSQILGLLKSFSVGMMEVFGVLMLTVVFLIFLMAVKLKQGNKENVVTKVSLSVSRYIWIKSSVSLLTALIVGLILFLIGVSDAYVFAIFVFLLNFIPNLGSVFATLLPLPFVFIQFGFGGEFIAAMLIPGVIQFAVGNVLEPKIMGQSLGLHPIAVLFFLIFWSIVWGPIGMFLAVPLTSVLKIICLNDRRGKQISNFLEGDFSALFGGELK